MSFAKHRSKCNSIGSDYAMQSPAHLCYSAPFKLLVHNFAKRLVSILNLCVGPPGTTYHTQVRRSVPCNPHVLQHLSLRFHLFFICVHTTHAGQTQCALQNPHVLQHLSLRFHLFFYLCSYDARRSDAACPATRTYYNTFCCAFTCFFICVHMTHAGQTQRALQPARTTTPFAALSPVFLFVFIRRTQVRRSVPCKTRTYYNTFRCAFTCFLFVFIRCTQVRRSVPCKTHTYYNTFRCAFTCFLFVFLRRTQVRRSVPCKTHTYYNTFCCAFTCFFICVHTTHAGQTQCALQPTRTTAPFAALSPVFVFVFLRRTQVRCSVPCKTYTYYNTFRCAFTCFVFVFLRRTQVRRSVPCNPHVLQHLSLRFHLFCICVHTTHAGQTQRAPAICTCNGSSCSAPRQQPFTCESSCCRGLLHI
jgi:hypothetical protein